MGENKYGGMTVNERLYLSGLLDKFERAVENKDVNLVISILKEVELTGSNIDAIIAFHNLK